MSEPDSVCLIEKGWVCTGGAIGALKSCVLITALNRELDLSIESSHYYKISSQFCFPVLGSALSLT